MAHYNMDSNDNDQRELIGFLCDELEEERRAVSRAVHDELGSLLLAAKMDLSLLARQVPEGALKAPELFDRISKSLDAAQIFGRRLVEQLRPGVLEHAGLFAAFHWYLEETCARAGVRGETRLESDEPEFSAEGAITLFRIHQALLAAIMQSATARNVTFTIRSTPAHRLEMIVESDASGSSHPHWLYARHCSVKLGGDCDLLPRADGIDIHVSVPLARVLAAQSAGAAIC